MIDHVGFTVDDFGACRRFYASALAELGYTLDLEPEPGLVGFRIASGSRFWLVEGSPTATVHIAFQAPDREAVRRFHDAALLVGGTDNGSPGPRPYETHYYAAFVLDPCGNNVEAVCRRSPVEVGE